jgi:uncharacterized membrane protein YgdD (TMEM256/DUF423 family)
LPSLTSRLFPALAAISALIAVAAGAFATHGLADARAKDLFHIGGQYELTHALAVFACMIVARRGSGIAAGCFLVGSALFSWSLYGLAFGAPHLVGILTPIGGLIMMAGWAVLAASARFGRAKTAA